MVAAHESPIILALMSCLPIINGSYLMQWIAAYADVTDEPQNQYVVLKIFRCSNLAPILININGPCSKLSYLCS